MRTPYDLNRANKIRRRELVTVMVQRNPYDLSSRRPVIIIKSQEDKFRNRNPYDLSSARRYTRPQKNKFRDRNHYDLSRRLK